MSQIKKKFIKNNAVDGAKIQLLNGQTLRAVGGDGVDRDLFYFNSSNELILSSMPKLSSMPLSDDDVVRKAYVDAEISSAVSSEQTLRDAAILAEETARLAGDAGLQSQINSILSNTDPAALDSLTEIVAAFQAADSSLNGAISSLSSSASSAVAAEASARAAADTTLQSNINAEASARAAADLTEASVRAAADTAEASARAAADTVLQNNLNSKTLDTLANVTISSKAGDDIIKWDSTASKWVNVAPLTAASVASVAPVSSSQAIAASASSLGQRQGVQGSGQRFGQTFKVGSNVYLDSIQFAFSRTGGTGAVGDSQQFKAFVFEYNTTKIPVLADAIASSSTFTASEVGYNAVALKNLVFSSSPLLSSSKTYVVFVSDPLFGTNDLYGINYFYSASTYADGNAVSVSPTSLSWSSDTNDYRMTINYLSSLPTQLQTGVIKTNASGLLDQSFLEYDVNFGGHKLQGVSAPTASTDATNKGYVDAADVAEASARAAADTAEASTRLAAVAALQSQINNILSNTDPAALDSLTEVVAAFQAADSSLNGAISALGASSSSALNQEIIDRQAADTAEASARAAADLTEQSARIAADAVEASARAAADTAEASARAAADTAEASTRLYQYQLLDTRITELEQFMPQKWKIEKTITSADVAAGFIQLNERAEEMSMMVVLDRVVLREGVDYTVVDAPVAGNWTRTKVVFTAAFMSGPEAIAVGDMVTMQFETRASMQWDQWYP
jgi:hypothetical protein